MPAGKYHFNAANESYVEQGASFDAVVTWFDGDDPIDLTGWTARMQVRQAITSPTTLAELTTENGKLTLGGALGTVTLAVDADETETYEWTNPAYYDLELEETATGRVVRLIEGTIELDPEVTR